MSLYQDMLDVSLSGYACCHSITMLYRDTLASFLVFSTMSAGAGVPGPVPHQNVCSSKRVRASEGHVPSSPHLKQNKTK